MPKEDLSCKISSVYKHKERKPKKPHYIPRPWGKPYNYKCFQCPFTCMEKSHLYNHMKYSLCKNSLSLLIESDWPYKKGNILPPDQLRPVPPGTLLRGRDEAELAHEALQDDHLRGEREDPDEGREHKEGEAPPSKEDQEEPHSSSSSNKGGKQAEGNFVITDVFSLEDHPLNAREVDTKLKHYKLSNNCQSGPSLLSEQWRLLTTRHRKSNPEGSLPCPDGGSIPCYPPPPAFADCQDPSGLNLSVLGVSYPLSPGLFSYSNPTVAHAQLAQLPFLASAAQLMQTPSTALQQADQAILPPHFYYPLLCEHAFGSTQDPGKGAKPGQSSPASMEPKPPPTFPKSPKISLWKLPALRPTTATAIPPPALWSAHHQTALSSEAGYRTVEEKLQAPGKGGKVGSWSHKAAVEVTSLREIGSKHTGAPLESEEAPPEKKPHLGCTLDLLKNLQDNPTFSAAAGQLFHNSFQTALHKSMPPEEWYSDLRKYQSESLEKAALPPRPLSPLKPGKALKNGAGRRDKLDKSAVLLGDLSKALQEYQEAERKIANLVQDHVPGQRYLREHLCKIRSELSHIHQALEKTTRQPEGPLDLSVKKTVEPAGAKKGQRSQGKGCLPEETEEEEEEKAVESESEGLPQESQSQSLKLLIKMSRASELSLGAVVKTEVVSPSGLRPPPPEALWPSRTTKCEADSSVLLCPDGRATSLVFTEFTPCSKSMKRPSSRDLSGETLCPHSPLSADP
ncbi:Proline-rich protein 35 [Acipenser ruthenus]|uniref:Proline-rich protein 35 n=1 Tax=Acipenser ruthenus TaxID=7906 RepID=A0A662Z1J1_ACIRT|nr:proline-rich protein 35-like [Acipenser ruthenus]RXN01679.1 Proline-rich protein 35 [Acipenser ruthenus]